MDPIPEPTLLDPERVLVNDRNEFTVDHLSDAAALERLVHEIRNYAQRLWHELDAVRHYLVETAPEDPRTAAGPVRTGATPTGPDDEAGWARWATAYASVTALLAGPEGDSGYGEQEARREQRDRRLPAATRRDEARASDPVDAEPADGGADAKPAPASAPHGAAAGPTAPPPLVPAAAAAAAALLVGRFWGRRSVRGPRRHAD